MKQQIIDNLANAEMLEKLYRSNKQSFAKAFSELTASYDSELIRFWKIRLAENKTPLVVSTKIVDVVVLIAICLITGFLVKIPNVFPEIGFERFYTRNLAVILFNGLVMYSLFRLGAKAVKAAIVYVVALVAMLLYLNVIPNETGHSSDLALMHAPLLMWCIWGVVFTLHNFRNPSERMEFIRFNGELVIMTVLILLAGGLLTALTLGLFTAINIDISTFYFDYIAIFGLVGAPVVAAYLTHSYGNITGKIAPVIAKVFTPLVLITLLVYLVSMLVGGSAVMHDRELLIVFNVMLLAVMAIVVFSLSELDRKQQHNIHTLILLLLTVSALIINAVALVAIVSRLFQGITPNRSVLAVSNLLIFVHLFLISIGLLRSYFRGESVDSIARITGRYLGVYAVWTFVVVFLVPVLFSFR